MINKALSVKNPFAWLIASGLKDVENRTWKTNFRGKFNIHVSQKWFLGAKDVNGIFTPAQWSAIQDHNEYDFDLHRDTFNTGCIIGEAELVDCVQDSNSIWAMPEHWHWILKNQILYDNPILNVKGSLGLWNCNPCTAFANDKKK